MDVGLVSDLNVVFVNVHHPLHNSLCIITLFTVSGNPLCMLSYKAKRNKVFCTFRLTQRKFFNKLRCTTRFKFLTKPKSTIHPIFSTRNNTQVKLNTGISTKLPYSTTFTHKVSIKLSPSECIIMTTVVIWGSHTLTNSRNQVTIK